VSRRGIAALVALSLAVGYMFGESVHADAGVIDRPLVERMVRALEAQTRALERCRR
jgi:hypothetical protein